MSIALLYDIHGNLLALNAVLADAEAAGADSYLLGGDYATFGPWPRETVERLQLLPHALWIRGNVERWLIDGAGPARNGHELVQNALRTANDALGSSLVTNRGEDTVSTFKPGEERNAFKINVGVKPNGVAFDPKRSLLIVANVGDPAIPGSHTASVVDVGRRQRIAEITVPGRTRWAVYNTATETFFTESPNNWRMRLSSR